jgi:tetratricopeptide (TPR) repeat protein
MKFLNLIYLIFPLILCSQEVNDPKLRAFQQQLKTSINDEEKIQALLDIGEYQIEREFNKAEQYFKEALEIIENNEDHYENKLAFIFNNLGVISRRKGNYGDAISFYFKSKDLFEKLRDTAQLAEVIHNTALLYRFENNDRKAVNFYNKSLKLSLEIKDSFQMAATYNMLGVSYRRLVKLDSALICYKKAEDLFKSLKKEEDVIGVYNNMATLYSVQKKYNKSLPIKLNSLAFYKKIGNKTSMATAYYNISRDYMYLKQPDIALKYVDSSLHIGLEEGLKERVSKVYLRKSAIYRNKKDFENAYRNYRYHKRYSDSIFNMQNIKKAKELELKYTFEREKKELETIAKQNKTKFDFYIFILFMVIFAIACITYLLWRNYTARARIIADKFEKEKLKQEILNQKIKVSETELKSLVADNSMRLKFIKELSSQLKEDRKKSSSSDIQKYIQSLLLKLSLQISTEEKLSKLQEKIKNVNSDFEEILMKNYPSLTQSEREVCGLLRINLSIKEVASIRNSTIDSIKSIRYRLRKKFELEKNIELEKFIQSL